MQETRVQSLGREDPLEKRMATHSSIFVWRIPWTDETGGLQSWVHGVAGWDKTEGLTLSHFHFHMMTIIKKSLKYFEIYQTVTHMKWGNAVVQMVPIDLIDSGLPEIINVKKQNKIKLEYLQTAMKQIELKRRCASFFLWMWRTVDTIKRRLYLQETHLMRSRLIGITKGK